MASTATFPDLATVITNERCCRSPSSPDVPCQAGMVSPLSSNGATVSVAVPGASLAPKLRIL